MKKRITALLLAAVLLFSAAPMSAAAEEFSGRVLETDTEGKATGRPVGGVKLFYITADGERTFAGRTDYEGRFTVEEKDDAKLFFEKRGFATKSASPEEREPEVALQRIAPAREEKVERIGGVDRYETTMKLARAAYDSANLVILASGENPADALTAGPLANALRVPVLLTPSKALYEEIPAYLDEMKTKNIIIVGGREAVSEEIQAKLAETYKTARIFGENRYETSAAVAEELLNRQHFDADEVILANGYAEADALAITPYAESGKKAVLLTEKETADPSVKKFIEKNGVKSVVFAGGTAVLSDRLADELGVAVGGRLAGKDRYETSLAVAKALPMKEELIVVNGLKPSDALAAAPLAKLRDGAVVLVEDDVAGDSVDGVVRLMREEGVDLATIVGGKASVGDDVRTRLEEYEK